MSSKDDPLRLREEAVALRRAGKSRREIKAILGIGNNTLSQALNGEPPPSWTSRPNAKDELRAAARALRGEGLSLKEIVAKLGVSKSSVSLWVRDPLLPPLSEEECRRRKAEASRRYWTGERPLREARRETIRRSAAGEIGELTDREILVAGAIAYWCEGSKSKPYRRSDRVIFTNSDPGLIKFFLRFLEVAGVPREMVTFRVQIHETADLQAAELFWLDVTGADREQFRATSLKRHNPTTVRRNVGVDYRGCLRIDVRQSADLYQRIEGWADAAMHARESTEPIGSGSEHH